MTQQTEQARAEQRQRIKDKAVRTILSPFKKRVFICTQQRQLILH